MQLPRATMRYGWQKRKGSTLNLGADYTGTLTINLYKHFYKHFL